MTLAGTTALPGVSSKGLMKLFKYVCLIFSILLLSAIVRGQNEQGNARQKLIDGNKRFVSSQMIHPNSSTQKRMELIKGQHPFAAIVSCSDSRVPPEMVFDQGLGDLFVVRTAGEVVDDIALASIEYAVEHLGVKLLVVMGHQKCGAVDAAVKGEKFPSHLNKLIAAIMPAVEKARKQKGDLLDNSVHENIYRIVAQLNLSKPVLEEFVRENKLSIIGAYYHLENGTVEFLK
jgi:carbonic anhydrase